MSKDAYFETTYKSSISTSLETRIDWPKLNLVWSEAWLRGDLVPPSGENDWSATELARIIRGSLGLQAEAEYVKFLKEFSSLHGVDSNARGQWVR
jgi:hypothetical protein